MRYVALLRGINVGGNNIIKMAELKACFEGMGFTRVTTYIQSGNVIFESSESKRESLVQRIEKVLSKRFRYASRVAVVKLAELKSVVKKKPKGFGDVPEDYRYDVIFLLPPITPSEAQKSISLKDGVDQVYRGKGVLYFSRLIAKVSQSKLPKIIGTPVYQSMTIRNWNTTTKLLSLAESDK